ncbi:YifB family Mg chelatase-like AAA ATPase [Candidatus Falkowbacteria bacterium]|nr:YifB family Mg chelatase-like AAA ATPase [Candidatus Falkowbacteria bacterium]
MSSKLWSATIVGLGAEIIEVEADSGGGELGTFSVVGLPDKAVSEARERVRSAIKNSGFNFPKLKVTINLAPAYIPKAGPGFDLPIAASILLMGNLFSAQKLDQAILVGELALNGDVRAVNGILPIVIKAREKGIKTIFVPEANASEAKIIQNIKVIPVKGLRQLILHLQDKNIIPEVGLEKTSFVNKGTENDMADIRGHEHAKRALEIAAAGNHNILLFGPPGSGKTLLAKTFPSIMPNLNLKEALEITKIYSVAGKLKESGIITSRPFRSPHHSASHVALVGGGTRPTPGEITLAHRGVLFLDEFPEFPRMALECLRQPLEEGNITISRAATSINFPAKFILISAMNPCPCGYLGDEKQACTCSNAQIYNYRKKVSGPILDRIDMHLEVARIDFDKLSSQRSSENSETIKKRVIIAKNVQKNRFSDEAFSNSEMNLEKIGKYCQLDSASKSLLENAVNSLNLSSRGYFRTLKLARTIADLDQRSVISSEHIAEALQYRNKEMFA